MRIAKTSCLGPLRQYSQDMPRPTITAIAALAIALSSARATASSDISFPAERLFTLGDQTEYGEFLGVLDVAINNQGDWAVQGGVFSESLGVNTQAVFTSFGANIAPRQTRLVDGVAHTQLTFGDVDLNNAGQLAYSATLVNFEPLSLLQVLVLNDQVILRDEDLSSWDFIDGVDPVRFGSLRRVQLNDEGQVLLGSITNDLPPASTNNPNLLSVITPTETGYVDRVAGAIGRPIPGWEQTSLWFVRPDEFGFNNSGQVAHLGGYDSTTEPGVFRQLWTIDDEVLFQAGTPSPQPGLLWGSTNAALDINNAGEWAASVPLGTTTFTRRHIVKNGTEVLIDPFEPQDSIGGLNILPRDSGIVLTDAGDVLFFADIVDLKPDNSIQFIGAGVFLNRDPLIVLNETIIDGKLVVGSAAPGSGLGFAVSDDGRWLITWLEFEDQSSGIYRFAIPTPGTVAILMLGATAALRRRR